MKLIQLYMETQIKWKKIKKSEKMSLHLVSLLIERKSFLVKTLFTGNLSCKIFQEFVSLSSLILVPLSIKIKTNEVKRAIYLFITKTTFYVHYKTVSLEERLSSFTNSSGSAFSLTFWYSLVHLIKSKVINHIRLR